MLGCLIAFGLFPSCIRAKPADGLARKLTDQSLTVPILNPSLDSPGAVVAWAAPDQESQDGGAKVVTFALDQGDVDQDLIFIPSSSNEELLPTSKIEITRQGTETGLITLTPISGRYGIATVIVTIANGYKTTETSFDVHVAPIEQKTTLETERLDGRFGPETLFGMPQPWTYSLESSQTSRGLVTLNDATTGTFSYQPVTAGADSFLYRITSVETGKSLEGRMNVLVQSVPPDGLSYSQFSPTYILATTIANNTPSSSGGAVTSYSITPALPTGLIFDTSTGVISGIPTAIQNPAVVHTITATNSGGSATATVTITVNEQSPMISYAGSPFVFTNGSAVSGATASAIHASSFAISSNLPAGLSFDISTGAITGTPTAPLVATPFIVTVTNSTGQTATTTINVTVNDVAPTGLTYSEGAPTYLGGTTITNNTPSGSGGLVTSYSITPALPTGLIFNTSTGVISGTPTAIQNPAVVHTITALNSGGNATATVTITVNEQDPMISYAGAPFVFTQGSPATGATATAANTSSFSISASLPAGLSFNSSTGAITGTPTALLVATPFIVTVTNSTGQTSSTTINVTVNDVAPRDLSYSESSPTYFIGTVITNNSPSSSGGPVTSYSITPDLPTGLIFNTSTGVISGTPTAIQNPAVVHTITAGNSGGNATATVTITSVNPITAGSDADSVLSSTPSIHKVLDVIVTGTALYPNLGISGTYANVGTGWGHTCGVTSDGMLLCWGFNVAGQLGDGTTIHRYSPVMVGTGYAQASGGYYHSCALKTDGTVWCWGDGILEDGTPNQNKHLPAMVGAGFSQISAGGYYHSCGLKTDQTLHCWGVNWKGQLGDNTTADSTSPVLVGTDYKQASAGGYHSCGVKNDGTLLCWGINQSGELGDGTTTERHSPVSIGTGYSQVATGYGYTCGVKTDGTVLCWGSNSFGQLGDGTTTDSLVPKVVGTGYTQVAAGYGHSCGLKTDGTLLCWGANWNGQLGDATTNASLSPVAAGAGFVQVSVGANYTCGRKTDGRLVCWGANSAGQLGTGGMNDLTAPPIANLGSCSVISVSGDLANASCSCDGLSCTMTYDTTGFSTGSGQIQYTVTDGSGTSSATGTLSVTVSEAPPSSLSYSAGSPTYVVGTAITDNTPASSGGAVTSYSITPDLPAGLSFSTSTGVISGTPAAIQNPAVVHTITALNSGGSTTATVTITVNAAPTISYSGSPFTLTKGSSFTLSATATNASTFSISASLPTGLNLNSATGVITGIPTELSAATIYSITATSSWGLMATTTIQMTINDVPPSGLAYSTANATYFVGTLMTNNTPSSSGGAVTSYSITPALPTGLSLNASTGVISGTPTVTQNPAVVHTITAANSGGSTTATVTIKVSLSGSITAGSHTDSRTEGDSVRRTLTVSVSGGATFPSTGPTGTYARVASGTYHSCGLKTDGTLLCWGANYLGQLGDGTGVGSVFPVSLGTDYAQLVSGSYHNCAIKTDGTLQCWGYNPSGQTGDGNTTNRLSPFTVGTGYAQVAAGQDHSCGIKTDGTLLCWGNNASGRLGDGTTTNRLAPVVVGSGFSKVSAGAAYTCGIKTDGTLQCWGSNSAGQLGDNTTTNRSSPVTVGTGYAQVTTGANHTCGIKTDGTLLCWGSNAYGQLGDNTITNRLTAVTVGTGYSQLSNGANHTCGIKTDGTLLCWGYNNLSQLGDNTKTNRLSPVTVGTGYSQVSGGYSHTLGIRNDNTLAYWGTNVDGQLGTGSTNPTSSPIGIPRTANSGTCLVTSISGDLTGASCSCDGVGCYMVYGVGACVTGSGEIRYTVTDGTGTFSSTGSVAVTVGYY